MDWVHKQVTLNPMLYKQLPVGIAYVKFHNPHITRGYANGFLSPIGRAIRQAEQRCPRCLRGNKKLRKTC